MWHVCLLATCLKQHTLQNINSIFLSSFSLSKMFLSSLKQGMKQLQDVISVLLEEAERKITLATFPCRCSTWLLNDMVHKRCLCKWYLTVPPIARKAELKWVFLLWACLNWAEKWINILIFSRFSRSFSYVDISLPLSLCLWNGLHF